MAPPPATRTREAPMKLRLSIAMASNPRTWPVLDGRVAADGIDLVCNVVGPSELFLRQLKYAEFDVSEMSFSSLIMAVAKGDRRWTGLPVFTTRRFFHTGILVRKDAKIESPADLKGKRVGVPEYQQTAALWTRGVLQHDFSVLPKDMEFWMERGRERSHAGAVGFAPPPGVTIHQIPPDKSIGSMVVSGELQAALHYYGAANSVDRSTVDLRRHPDVKTLFPDPAAEGVRFWKKWGIYPINHGMVVRREIAESSPWVVANLLNAFNRANAIADRERLDHLDYYIETGLVPREAAEALRRPLVSHGVAPNRKVLETAARFSVEQGLTPRPIALEEVFAASTVGE
jgi:4,5-dihydroxyphthalate decarboxylase